MRLLIRLALLCLLLLGAAPAHAGSVVYGFGNGSTDGWAFPYNSGLSQGPGVWSVQSGALVQSFFGDNIVGFVHDLRISTQSIEAQVKSLGYAGVVLWYNQVDGTWANYVSVVRSTQGPIWVTEYVDGTAFRSSYDGPWWSGDWYHVSVEADGATGGLKVRIDDPLTGQYEFTHLARTPYRTGFAGLTSGNHYAYFDDFQLASDEIVPVPETGSTLLLLGLGVSPVGALRRRLKK